MSVSPNWKPNLNRDPMLTRIFERNTEGTLLCICGKRGREFVHVQYGILRGICSKVCYNLWVSSGQETIDIDYAELEPLCDMEMEMNDELLEPNDATILDNEIKSAPLVGPDEVTHKGRHITLTGEAWLRRKVVIDSLTDEELKVELASMKEAVHEAEIILDYRRIIKNNLENSLELRTTKFSRLQLLRMTQEAHESARHGEPLAPRQTRSVSVGEGNDLKNAIGALGKLGLSKEKLILLIQKLAQKKEPK